jgi:hypothetical protein
MLELCYELRTPFVMSVAANQVCDKLLSFILVCMCVLLIFLHVLMLYQFTF